MNASISNPKGSDKIYSSDQDTDFAAAAEERARPRSVKKLSIVLLVFCGMSVVSWMGLSWLASLHEQGRLLNESTVSTVLTLVVAIALIVVVPIIVRGVRTAKHKVESGEGILSSASIYLDSNTKTPLLTRDDFQTGIVKTVLRIFSEKRPAAEQKAQSVETEVAAHQSTELATAHQEASRRIKEFNCEMENLFPRWKQRIGAYEQRVEELERELASKETENGELLKRQIELVNQHLSLAREKAGDDEDTEFESKPPDTSSLHGGTAVAESLKHMVAPKQPKETAAEKAAQMTRQFRHDTESLSKEEKIKVYEERIAAMENALAGTEAENKELTWNQLQYMQKRLESLTGKPYASVQAHPLLSPGEPITTPVDAPPTYRTEIRRRAALSVAELNERLARMYPDSGDRIAAYEKRLARIEQEISTRSEEHREMLECQMAMARNYVQLMQGVPEVDQPAPASNDVLSQMFGLQFDLNSTDQEAARQVADFNQELKKNNSTNDEQVRAYKQRISELEAVVEQKDQENPKLYEAQLELVQCQLDHMEETTPCDQSMNGRAHLPQVDESGVPQVRIPEFQRAKVKEEIPREIRALLDRKPMDLKIKGVKPRPPRQTAG